MSPTSTITLRLPTKIKQAIVRAAKADNRTMSSFLVHAAVQLIKKGAK